MRRILAVGILCVMGLILLVPAHAADRIALVIGNAKYAHAPKLKNPVNDARAIADKLKQVGFRVVMGIDLEVDDLRAKILEFSRQIEKADVALLYYAGHAVQVDGRNLIIPIDANIKNEADLDFQSIPLNLILRQMERRNRTNLVFLDACRDNPFAKDLARSMGSRSLGLGRGLARVSSGLGTLIAFATQPGNVAYDGDPKAKHSPFTSALLEYIAIPGHDINTLLIKVRQKVIAMTNGKQVPWENSSLTGAFYFLTEQAQKAASAPQPSNPKTGSSGASDPRASNQQKLAQATPAPKTAAPNAIASQIELEFWRSVRDSKNRELIGAYLKRYPNGSFADLAKLKLKLLQPPPEPTSTLSKDKGSAPKAPGDKPKTAQEPQGQTDAQKLKVAIEAIDRKDYLAAIEKILPLAEKGNRDAQFRLGILYTNWKSTERNYKLAERWLLKAAKAGHTGAQNSLGYFYHIGRTGSSDYAKAIKWFSKAAWSGNPHAQFNLAVMYQRGHGVPKDHSKAAKWFREAFKGFNVKAKEGDSDAKRFLGLMLAGGHGTKRNETKAIGWFRKAAKQGDNRAQYSLGIMYRDGKGIPQDKAEAIKWFRKAAEQNNISAQYMLGHMYSRGNGVEKNYKIAVQWYRRAAEQGSPRAQHNLGSMYSNGQGVTKDLSVAVNWFRKAAEQGVARSQTALGLSYKHGWGVPIDYSKAMQWYRKAIRQGYPNAMHLLGTMYLDGTGVKADKIKAYMWYKVAADVGNKKLSEAFERSWRWLTASERREVITLAEQCKKKKYKGC